jgi:hypothetical protein
VLRGALDLFVGHHDLAQERLIVCFDPQLPVDLVAANNR